MIILSALAKQNETDNLVPGHDPSKRVDDRLDTAKMMLDDNEEAELFPAGESLLHGGGTKAVTYRDWAFATLFLGNIALIVFMWFIFMFVGRGSSTPSQHRMFGRDVSVALYASGTIALGFAFLWLGVMKVHSHANQHLPQTQF